MPKYGCYLHPRIRTSHPQMQVCGGWQQLCSSTSPTPSASLIWIHITHLSPRLLWMTVDGDRCYTWQGKSLQEVNLEQIFQRSQRCFPSLFICLFAAFAPQIVFWEGFSTQLALGRGWTSLSQNNFLSPLFASVQSGNFKKLYKYYFTLVICTNLAHLFMFFHSHFLPNP